MIVLLVIVLLVIVLLVIVLLVIVLLVIVLLVIGALRRPFAPGMGEHRAVLGWILPGCTVFCAAFIGRLSRDYRRCFCWSEGCSQAHR